MLLDSPRLTARDREVWARLERQDAVLARASRLLALERAAAEAVVGFARERCYAGVSWGKDSVVLAHLVVEHAPHVPLVWVRVEPVANPDCPLVRDAFLASHPGARYEEIRVAYVRSNALTSQRGFDIAADRHGNRYLSGIRGAESGPRKARMRRHGTATARTCAPLGWWRTADVFAYLHARRLPVHPAYAMTEGGTWDRERIRVAALGGNRGTGFGRREWERRYYRAELRAIGRDRLDV